MNGGFAQRLFKLSLRSDASCDAARKKHVKGHPDWMSTVVTLKKGDWNSYWSSYNLPQGTEKDHWVKLDFCLWRLQRRQAECAFPGFHRPTAPEPSVLVLSGRLQYMQFSWKPFADLYRIYSSLHLSNKVKAKGRTQWEQGKKQGIYVSQLQACIVHVNVIFAQSPSYSRAALLREIKKAAGSASKAAEKGQLGL